MTVFQSIPTTEILVVRVRSSTKFVLRTAFPLLLVLVYGICHVLLVDGFESMFRGLRAERVVGRSRLWNARRRKSVPSNGSACSSLRSTSCAWNNVPNGNHNFRGSSRLFSAVSQQDSPPLIITSQPVTEPKHPHHNTWNPSDPLAWCQTFGSRSPARQAYIDTIANLPPQHDHTFPSRLDKTTVVTTPEHAAIVLQVLMDAPSTIFHACDTEVMDIDLKNVGPVGNGYVTCLSVYSGPDFDYGLGDGPGTRLWIDNLDDSYGLLNLFKPWLESEAHAKVWHNYGFDRHVLFNEGIDVKGFGGDTMHMARLQDTSRLLRGGYSLEALTDDLLDARKTPMKELFGVPKLLKDGTPGKILELPPIEELQRNPATRAGFIEYSCYDVEGTWNIREELQRLLKNMTWIPADQQNLYDYYQLYMRPFGEILTDMERRGIRVNATDYLAGVEIQARKDRDYHEQSFRSWAATFIGADGFALNPASSNQLQTFLFGGYTNPVTKVATDVEKVFKIPRVDLSEQAVRAYEDQQGLREKIQAATDGQPSAEGQVTPDEFDSMTVEQLKNLCRERKLKLSGKKSLLQERLRESFLSPDGGADADPTETNAEDLSDGYDSMTLDDLRDSCQTRALSDKGTKKKLIERLRADAKFAEDLIVTETPTNAKGYKTVSEALAAALETDGPGLLADILSDVREKLAVGPKNVDLTIASIGMTPEKFTDKGGASVTADVLRKLAGEPFGDEPKYGTAYKFFNGGQRGHDACVGLYSLTAIGSIDTMISNFLTSLQSLADDQSRVHCALNLNTETGRLSSRRPNLQNQPALEKDKYKIRKAFEACPGNNLIVADYGQLELRLLASMTRCQSMISAFKEGGDFHSRTAIGMFDYIQEKVDSGEILFEWDYANGAPPKPLVKDEYASERRKAKTLNFSIAYGKTAHGLSQDWGVSKTEAEDMLQAWYNSRPEVRDWQAKVKQYARNNGITRTLMGRYRQLPGATGKDRKLIGMAERASINTPIQGGAADVAMMAMLKINNSEKLKRLGWILLMQIHDEVILEGPEETAVEAFDEVITCMQEPWVYGLEETSVPLLVDGSYIHKNWFDAK